MREDERATELPPPADVATLTAQLVKAAEGMTAEQRLELVTNVAKALGISATRKGKRKAKSPLKQAGDDLNRALRPRRVRTLAD